MRHTIVRIVDRFLDSYWILPSALVVGAAALSLFTVAIDERGIALGRLPYIYTRDPDGARALLTTIAGSIATIAGVVFSITLVTLTLASNQFGSRILRNFSRNTGNKIVLGVMLGTFLYSLLVVRTISRSDGQPFVPHLSVIVGIALALLSLAMLIYFIHHSVTSIQPENVIAALAGEAHTLVNQLYPEELRESDAEPPPTHHPYGQTVAVPAAHSGYLASIDDDALLRLAVKSAVVVRVRARPGDFVERGRPLAELIGDGRAANPADFGGAFEIGAQRTYVEDLDFALQQITLVAVRALSPSINDPFNAITCLDRLGAVLGHLAGRKMSPLERRDRSGGLRVIGPRPGYRELAESAFIPITEAARGNYTVTAHMLATLSDALSRVSFPAYHRALWDLRERVYHISRTAMAEPLRVDLDHLYHSLSRGDSPRPKRMIGGSG